MNVSFKILLGTLFAYTLGFITGIFLSVILLSGGNKTAVYDQHMEYNFFIDGTETRDLMPGIVPEYFPEDDYQTPFLPPEDPMIEIDYKISNSSKELECLSKNIYFESRDQSIEGKYAVGIVTLNRVLSKRYPSTICKVVWQKGYVKRIKRYIPQFSWTLDGKSDIPYEIGEWEESNRIASDLYNNYSDGIIKRLKFPKNFDKVKFYHADYVKPYWSKNKKRLIKIGNHIFYI